MVFVALILRQPEWLNWILIDFSIKNAGRGAPLTFPLIEHNNHHSIIMQKDICYNVEKMHEPFPFTQDNQWDDSYFYKGENALPESLIKSKPKRNLPILQKNRRLLIKLIWNSFTEKKCIFYYYLQ